MYSTLLQIINRGKKRGKEYAANDTYLISKFFVSHTKTTLVLMMNIIMPFETTEHDEFYMFGKIKDSAR